MTIASVRSLVFDDFHVRCALDMIAAVEQLGTANRESCLRLPWLYSAPDVPCLERKRATWLAYLSRSRGAEVK